MNSEKTKKRITEGSIGDIAPFWTDSFFIKVHQEKYPFKVKTLQSRVFEGKVLHL